MLILLTQKLFSWIATSTAEAVAINPKATKTLLANAWSTFPIKGKPILLMVQEVRLEIPLTAPS